MPKVVFLRGANVGGHAMFRPTDLVRKLARWDVVNIGAAGTFVALKEVGAPELEREILKNLRFRPTMIIRPGEELLRLAKEVHLGERKDEPGVKWTVSVLAHAPTVRPKLPFSRPSPGAWEVRVLTLWECYVVSRYRRLGERILYPNSVVENEFGVDATTRDMKTIDRICALVRPGK